MGGTMISSRFPALYRPVTIPPILLLMSGSHHGKRLTHLQHVQAVTQELLQLPRASRLTVASHDPVTVRAPVCRNHHAGPEVARGTCRIGRQKMPVHVEHRDLRRISPAHVAETRAVVGVTA